ncbi:TOBE domain protein [Thermoplasmatales archaeon BRNA1]|nr:TOBE domain protein [Thermoplasmatales archaeon BRNA1]
MLYEGTTITIEVEVEGIGLVSAKRSSRRYEAYNQGDIVAVTWQPEKASVFRIPENGLEDELRLD